MKNRAFRRTSLRYPVANYADIVRAGWRLWRDRPALVFRGQSLTYGKLDEASRAFSGQLQATGFQPGDVAVLWLGNTPGCLAAVLGTLAAGGVVLPQHVAAPPPEVADRIGATDASLLVVDAVRDRAEAAAASGGTPATLLSVPNLGDDIGERPRGEVPADTGAASRTAPSGSDLALLPFSSGTTGLPKGVHLSHANLVAGLFQFADAIDIGANDRLVHFVPLSHIYGLMVAGAALANGASLVLQERYAFDDVVADVERHRATMLFGVSQVIVDLVAQASGIAGAFDSLRFVNTGSAPLAAEVMRELERETGIMVTVGYGLTEAAPACHAPVTSPHLIDLETVGYPVADTKLRFVHPDNPAREGRRGRGRGAPHPGAPGRRRLLERARGDDSHLAQRLAPHWRPRASRCLGPGPDRRPAQVADQIQGLQCRARGVGGHSGQPPCRG